ncbi:ABC transporter substrate-binding protein [Candidatus Poriferisodalis sp.]|uniref:ABC transporter substrate-binding protein n=1 Tax=Candidatus Poriferisodalis sp. TaxID=3101277 RepID=UPI003AF6C309
MKKKWVQLLALLLAFTLITAACGSDDDATSDAPSDAPSDDTAPAADQDATADDVSGEAAAEADEPAAPEGRSGTLKWALGSNGANFFDPHKATNPFGRSWMYPFYDRLTRIDGNGDVQAMLATNWEFSGDGSVLTFDLREGVLFHDGTSFDATAAKINIDRARDPAVSGGTFVDLLAIDSVDVIDNYTIQINLKAPGGALPALLSDQAGMMISPAAMDNEDLATMPVGAGPFVATEFRVDEAMFAVAFDDYWNPEFPKVENLELRFVLDPSTRVNATVGGEVDGGVLDTVVFTRDDVADLGLVISERFSTALYQLFINTERVPELSNPAVRRALAMAIDQEAFGAALFNGECAPIDQVFGKGWFAHNPDIDADYHPFDPDGAKAILEAEGVTDLEFTVITANIPSFVAMAEAIQAFFADVGVTINVAPTPIPELISGFVVNKTADAYWSLNPGAADPAKFVATIWLPQSPFNPGGYEVPGVFDLHVRAQAATNEADRAPLYHEMAQLLVDEQLTVAVCTPASLMAHRPEVGGVSLLSTLSDVDVIGIYIDE